MSLRLPFLLTLLVAAVCLVHGKVVRTSTSLSSSNEWRYLSKFGCAIGTGKFSLRAKIDRPIHDPKETDAVLQLDVYLDEHWDTVGDAQECFDKRQPSKVARYPRLPLNGSWSEPVEGTLSQSIRPHVWYFALSDCKHDLLKFTNGKSVSISYELTLLNPGDSHFSVEDQGLLTVNFLLCIVFFGFFGLHIHQMMLRFKSEEKIHTSVQILNSAIAMQLVSIVSQIIHLTVYSMDGRGWFLFNFISQASTMLAQVLLCALFILIAWGWTITHNEIQQKEIFIPVLAGISVIHVVLLFLGRVLDDDHNKFHENEGLPGILTLMLRLGLFGWFFIGARETLMRERNEVKRGFLHSFILYCSIFFLAYPVLFVVTSIFAPYLRQKVMLAGLVLMQSAALYFVSNLFVSRGAYSKVSTLSAPILPGGKSD
eukprot:GILK01004346.1.p1 GENE.GILK01004346.1~~GILK01004346.1.p1  ORF type:complete len:426 (+),score=63.19 GILK01004346.1:147-1424(+)